MTEQIVTSENGAGASDRLTTLIRALTLANELPRPDPSQDSLLDATERCVTRYGFRRTSMSDLAREMNIARSTLYRQVDSVDEAILLVMTRVVYRFLDEVGVAMLSGKAWPQLFVETVTRLIELTGKHPVIRRLVEHEPDMVVEILTRDLGHELVRNMAEIGVPVLEAAMANGQMRKVDAQMATAWLARIIIVMILVPPDEDLENMVQFALAGFLPAN